MFLESISLTSAQVAVYVLAQHTGTRDFARQLHLEQVGRRCDNIVTAPCDTVTVTSMQITNISDSMQYQCCVVNITLTLAGQTSHWTLQKHLNTHYIAQTSAWHWSHSSCSGFLPTTNWNLLPLMSLALSSSSINVIVFNVIFNHHMQSYRPL